MMSTEDLEALSGMFENSGALQLKQIENQYGLGKAQLKNQWKIAQLQSGTQRYGIDTQREIAMANIAQARDELERLGIPKLELDRWVAQKQQELAESELEFKRDQWAQQFGLQQGELTGVYNGQQTLAGQQQQFQQGIEQGQLTGTYRGQQTLPYQQFLAQQEELARRYGLDVGRFGQEQLEQARRYGLDVAQFGAQLASTPDTYYQSQRFNATELPRLMGMAGQSYAGPGPTAGVARMGQYLQQGLPQAGAAVEPAGNPVGGGMGTTRGFPESSAYAGGGGSSGTYGGGGAPSMQNEIYDPTGRARQFAAAQTGAAAQDPRARQIAQVVKAVPPSAYDGLNETDSAALRLMESIYKAGGQSMDAGSYARLKASGRTGFLKSAGAALGFSPADLDAEFQSYRPVQGSSSMAG